MEEEKEFPIKNKIYEILESNKLISYEKNISNKLVDKISLNDNEKNCFKIIKDILKKNNLDTTICRIAGGWVRDKLLGKESDDIDIALNNMKGSNLATLINEELYPGKDKVGIILQNAEKGKHLETATIKINNISIDFVNLRSDEKDKIGTPLEDAERRDLSINSLFYNINEEKVEDWTKKGINDLKNGIIDTPIDSEITFKDDPLRILRMLRFALKYKFKISDNINNCIEKNIEEYKNNYSKTISEERIEKELYKILKMDNSSFAIAYLYEYKLLEDILQPIKYNKNNEYIIDNKLFLLTTNIYIIGEYLYKNKKLFDINLAEDNFNKIDYCLLLLTLNFRNMKTKLGKENTNISKLILRETFKTSNDYIKENQIMNENFDDLISLVNSENFNRLSVGRLLKKIYYKNIIKMLYACISYEYIVKIKPESLIDNINDDELKTITEKYKKFFDFIKNENMLHIDELKPIFNGKEIMKILEMKPSKEIGKLLEILLEEQIEKPNINKEEALDFLKKKRKEICVNENIEFNKDSKKKKKKKDK